MGIPHAMLPVKTEGRVYQESVHLRGFWGERESLFKCLWFKKRALSEGCC